MSTVLLIDDEPDMAMLVEMCLKNVKVASATNLAEAIAVARAERPRAVLLDIALNGEEDGLELLPRLRQEAVLSDVPIIGFSIHGSRRQEALEKGLEGFVAKPFKAAALREALRPYLD
jgi:CheY-like chemotaxis protein